MKAKKLTKEDAIKAVEQIKKRKDDSETAHGYEDDLRDRFIECCAMGCYTIEEVSEIGKIVLSTNEIEFSRWYS